MRDKLQCNKFLHLCLKLWTIAAAQLACECLKDGHHDTCIQLKVAFKADLGNDDEGGRGIKSVLFISDRKSCSSSESGRVTEIWEGLQYTFSGTNKVAVTVLPN